MVINLLLQTTCRSSGLGTNVGFGGVYARCLGAIVNNQINQWPLINYIQNRGAARRGKRIQRAREARERASKRRLQEAQNPKTKKNQKYLVKLDKTQFRFQTERQLDLTLPNLPPDDVFFMENFRRKRFSLEEILELHRQSVHPDVLNRPDALVSATIELNLKMKLKKKRFIKRIESTLCYPYLFKKYEMNYSLKRDPDEPGFGFIECFFGNLEMSDDQLKVNLRTLFDSVNRFKPMNLEDGKQFFERVMITTPATTEIFLLKFWEIIDDYEDPSVLSVDEYDENTHH